MPNLIKNQIYEVDFFNIIDITGDGNCLFRSISFYIYGSEYFYSDIRELTFKYIKNNITKFYEYCYIENGTYYINVEEGTIVRKFILDEYVSHIEEEGFFSGFIEINALSIIYNRPIVILDNLSYKNKIYFNKIAVFNNILQPIYNLEDIIFINFINKNHYQSLTLNKNFIIDRIKKNTYLKENIIIFNKKTNKIIRIESEKQDKSDNFINISDDTEEKKIEKEGKKNENIIHQNKKSIKNDSNLDIIYPTNTVVNKFTTNSKYKKTVYPKKNSAKKESENTLNINLNNTDSSKFINIENKKVSNKVPIESSFEKRQKFDIEKYNNLIIIFKNKKIQFTIIQIDF